jgi:hypothetical protein
MRNFEICNESDCDYDSYYISQTGYGSNLDEISYYSGLPFQRGYNILTRFGSRFAIPFLKYAGKKTLERGKNIIKDVLSGADFKAAIKSNLKRLGSESLSDASEMVNQSGSRVKRLKKGNKKLKLTFKYLKAKSGRKIKKLNKRSIKRNAKVLNKRKIERAKDIFD